MFKNVVTAARRLAGNTYARVGAGVSVAGHALAQTAPTIPEAAKAGVDAAKADGMTIGGYVVGAVAVLVVIGLAISLVRKL
ncbi:MAG TPA: hypothetical protein VFF03_13510 [Rhodocyclaceae bacterium]|nr:hypothetical protein [Rhodocyclaceae bacterium]